MSLWTLPLRNSQKHLTKLVHRAEHGEEVVITRHGNAAAKLVQVQPKERLLGIARDLIKETDPDWWKPCLKTRQRLSIAGATQASEALWKLRSPN